MDNTNPLIDKSLLAPVVEEMLTSCWASVIDGGPVLRQHWFNTSRVWWDFFRRISCRELLSRKKLLSLNYHPLSGLDKTHQLCHHSRNASLWELGESSARLQTACVACVWPADCSHKDTATFFHLAQQIPDVDTAVPRRRINVSLTLSQR